MNMWKGVKKWRKPLIFASLFALAGVGATAVYALDGFTSETKSEWQAHEAVIPNGHMVNAEIRQNINLTEKDSEAPQGETSGNTEYRYFIAQVTNGSIDSVPSMCVKTLDNGSHYLSYIDSNGLLRCAYSVSQNHGIANLAVIPVRASAQHDGDKLSMTIYADKSNEAVASPDSINPPTTPLQLGDKLDTLPDIPISLKDGLNVGIDNLADGWNVVAKKDGQTGYFGVGVYTPAGSALPENGSPITFDVVLSGSGLDTSRDVHADFSNTYSFQANSGRLPQVGNVTGMTSADFNRGFSVTGVTGNTIHVQLIPDKSKMFAMSTMANGTSATGNTLIGLGNLRVSTTHKTAEAGSLTATIKNVKYTSTATTNLISDQNVADTVKDDNSITLTFTPTGRWNSGYYGNAPWRAYGKGNTWVETNVYKGLETNEGVDVQYTPNIYSWAGTYNIWSGNGRAFGDSYVQGRTSTNATAGEAIGDCVIIPAGQKIHFAFTRATGIDPATRKVAWYTGKATNDFNCGDDEAHWTYTAPKDMTTVTAIRFTGIARETTVDLWYMAKTDSDMTAGDQFWQYGGAYFADSNAGEGNRVGQGAYWHKGDHANSAGKVTDIPNGTLDKFTTGSSDVGFGTSQRAFITMNLDDNVVPSGDTIKVTGIFRRDASRSSTSNADGTLTYTLPQGATYVEGSMTAQGVSDPDIKHETDGRTVLTFKNVAQATGVDTPYSFEVKVNAPSNTYGIYAQYKIPYTQAIDEATSVSNAGQNYSVIKRGETTLLMNNTDDGQIALSDSRGLSSWSIKLTNNDSDTQDVMDVITTLPFDGDVRGNENLPRTTTYNTINGNGADIYVTTADKTTLSSNPQDSSNGSLGNPSSIWTRYNGDSSSLKNVTGIRAIYHNVPSRATKNLLFTLNHDGAVPERMIKMSAIAGATTTQLKMVQATSATSFGVDSETLFSKKLLTNLRNKALAKGETLDYEATVTMGTDNHGNGSRNISSQEMGGTFLTNVTMSNPSVGTITDNGTKWVIGDVPAGTVAKVHMTGVISDTWDGKSAIDNRMCVTSDGARADNQATCDSASAEENTVLQIHKTRVVSDTNQTATSDDDYVRDGDTVYYKVTALNSTASETMASNVRVKDLGSDQLTDIKFVSTSKGSVSDSGEWTIGHMAIGETQTAIVSARVVNPQGTGHVDNIYNKAIIYNDKHPKSDDPHQQCTQDSAITDDNDQCTVTEDKTPSYLKVQKDFLTPADKLAYARGEKADFKITVKTTDNGYGDKNVTLTEVGGKNLSNKGVFTDMSQGSVDGTDSHVWNIGTMGRNQTVTAIYTTSFADDYDGSFIENTVYGVGKFNPRDKVTQDNTDTACVVNTDGTNDTHTSNVDNDTDQCDKVKAVDQSHVRIAKRQMNADGTAPQNRFVLPHKTIRYQVEVLSDGKTNAGDIIVHEQPSAQLTNVTLSNPSHGTINGTTWNVGNLAVGERATVDVTATVDNLDDSTVITNHATVENPHNPYRGDKNTCQANNDDVTKDTDQCDVTTVREESKLQIEKHQIDRGNLHGKSILRNGKIGTTNYYYVTVKNSGKSDAWKVTSTDLGDPSLTNVQFIDVDYGAVDSKNKAQWNIGDLDEGAEVHAVVSAQIKAITADYGVRNTVVVSNPRHPLRDDTVDLCQVNNSDVDKDVDQCDRVTYKENSHLRIFKTQIKSAEDSTPDTTPRVVGDTVVYSIDIKNSGVDTASDVISHDLGDDTLTDIRIFNVSQGTVDKSGDIWTIGDIPAGQTVHARVIGTVRSISDEYGIKNTAIVYNPTHPHDVTDKTIKECVFNTSVDNDTDQCDYAQTKKVVPITPQPQGEFANTGVNAVVLLCIAVAVGLGSACAYVLYKVTAPQDKDNADNSSDK